MYGENSARRGEPKISVRRGEPTLWKLIIDNNSGNFVSIS
jgi:hypothetical protein